MQDNNFNKLLEVLEDIKKELQEVKRIAATEQQSRNSKKIDKTAILSIVIGLIGLLITVLDYFIQ